MGLENINNDIKEIAKKIQELEKSNLEARAMIEAKRDRESRAI
jgi:predicted alpha/beta superfamily hydrolase